MIFTIVILLMLVAVIFFHYVQGFFSAALSAIFAVIAAVVALSYHETIVERHVGDAMGDWGPPVMLLVLFTVVYFILRIIFDKAVPGGIRLPAALDKMAGGAMGLVAGTFGLGIVVIAAQQMPLGPAVGGYARYETNSTRNIVVPTGGNTRAKDANSYDEMVSNTFSPDSAKKMIVPMDDVVVGAVARLSEGGSLDAGKPFRSVHPDYLQELFGQRMGVETGSTLAARNRNGTNAVDVVGLYRAPALPDARVVDHEFTNMRVTPLKNAPVPGDEARIVVRVSFTTGAADKKDNRIRLAPGSVRIVAKRPDETGELTFHNYFPIGTMDPSGLMYLNKIDDPLYINVNALKASDSSSTPPQVDFVFQVRKRGFFVAGEEDKPDAAIEPGTFLEVKKFARVELTGPDKGVVKATMNPPTVLAVWRKHLEWEKSPDGKVGPAPRNPGGGTGTGGMMGMMGSGMPSGMPPGGPPGGSAQGMPPGGQPPAAPAAPAGMTPDQAKGRIVGTWTNTTGSDTLTYTFNADGTYTGQSSAGKAAKGTWKVTTVAGNVASIELTNTATGNASQQKWELGSDNNQMTWQKKAGPAVFTRKS